MKILVVQSAFIGDVVLTLPLVEAVKQSAPASEVDFLTLPLYEEFLARHKSINQVIADDKRGKNRKFFPFLKFARRIREEKYDVALIPHRSFRSGLLIYLAGVKKRFGFDNAAGKVFYTEKVHYERGHHEVERNLSLAKAAGFGIWDGRWNLPFNQGFAVEKSDIPLVVVSPFSNWQTKMWLVSRWVELINELSKFSKVAIVGSVGNMDLWEEMRKGVKGKILDFVGKTDFLTLASIIKNSDVLVSNDSAPLHFASAFGVKSVVIYGPTIPGFGFGPYKQKSVIVERDLPCRPCNIHGPRKCPLGHHDCMKKILPSEVLDAVRKLLGR